jgi:hypothetical protein
MRLTVAYRNAIAPPPRKILPSRAAARSGPASLRRSPRAGCRSDYKLLQLPEQARDPRSDRSSGQFAGELQEEPPLFHFQQRQRDSVG